MYGIGLRPVGGDLVPTIPGCMCELLGSEVSENIALKMGVKFAASFNMGKGLR